MERRWSCRSAETNENDILTRSWNNGRYSTPGVSRGMKEKLGTAIDILVSSNFERLLWDLAFENVEGVGIEELRYEVAFKTVDGWTSRVKNDGRVEAVGVLEWARKDFLAEKVSDELVSFVSILFIDMLVNETQDKSRDILRSHPPPLD